MALANYSDLLSEVDTEMHNSLQTYTPDWIILVENDMKRRLRVPEMIDRATASSTSANPYLALPTGFLTMRALHINSDPVRNIEIVDVDFLSQNYTTSQGKPYYAGVFGSELKFDRPFDDVYELEMIYYHFPTGLSATNTTNDLMTHYPHLYLWGCCARAAKFLRNDKEFDHYQSMYKFELELANKATEEYRYGSTLRIQSDVVAV